MPALSTSTPTLQQRCVGRQRLASRKIDYRCGATDLLVIVVASVSCATGQSWLIKVPVAFSTMSPRITSQA
jgi:hypothetical protein